MADTTKVLLAVPAPHDAVLVSAAEAVGASVWRTTDRAELLQLARMHLPHVAVVDLSPSVGAGGAAMASMIQQTSPGTRIIFTGENSGDRSFIEALVVGDFFLPQPIEPTLAQFALRTLLVKTSLSRTGQYQLSRKYNSKAAEATAMRNMSVKLAGARTAGQVAEIVKGALADALPFHLFAFVPAPIEEQLTPRVYVQQPTTEAQYANAVASLQELARESFGATDAVRAITPDVVRQRLYGSLEATPDATASADMHGLHWHLDGDREQTVGFVAIFRPTPFEVPQPVMTFVQSMLTLAALTLARQAEAHAETISTLRAIIESRSDGLMWIEPRRNPIILNRRARQLLALPETGPANRAEITARLREAELYDDFFGPDAKLKQSILKAKRLPGSDEPHQIELVRVFDDQRLPIGVLLLIREPGRERDSAALEEFIENLGHEIKVPLNALMGHAEMLLEGIEGPLSEGQTISLKHIVQGGKKILGVFDYFAAATRMSARGLVKKPVDTAALFESVVGDFKLPAEKIGATLEIAVARPADTLRVDADQFRIVLNNLVSNALKFSPEGGKVVLTAQAAGADAMRYAPREPGEADAIDRKSTTKLRRQFVELSCTDEGPGVAEADRERIFERFVQADAPTRADADLGTGLGLAITENIVTAHGGKIWVEPNPAGHGARFRILLPGGYSVANE